MDETVTSGFTGCFFAKKQKTTQNFERPNEGQFQKEVTEPTVKMDQEES